MEMVVLVPESWASLKWEHLSYLTTQYHNAVIMENRGVRCIRRHFNSGILPFLFFGSDSMRTMVKYKQYSCYMKKSLCRPVRKSSLVQDVEIRKLFPKVPGGCRLVLRWNSSFSYRFDMYYRILQKTSH